MLYIVTYNNEKGASVFERSETALKFLEKIRERCPDAQMVCTDEPIHTKGGGMLDPKQYNGESDRVWTGLNGKQARKYKKKYGKTKEKEEWKATK